jgi:hypothetical protein
MCNDPDLADGGSGGIARWGVPPDSLRNYVLQRSIFARAGVLGDATLAGEFASVFPEANILSTLHVIFAGCGSVTMLVVGDA